MHILIATDGSAHAHIALQQCLSIANNHKVRVTILTVITNKDEEPAAKAILGEASALLQTAVNAPISKIRIGSPDEEIVAEGKSNYYNLILLGEKSQHNFLTRLMGSTAQRVITQTERPVLLAKQQARDLHRILICDSGVQTPSLPERIATLLPEIMANAQDVTVLHVMSQISAAPGIPGKELRAGAKELMAAETPEGEWLTHDLHVLEQVEVLATPKVRHGLVVEEILAEASDGRYDLVVIGAHPQEGWQRFLLEDVAAQIILKADQPVLVIP